MVIFDRAKIAIVNTEETLSVIKDAIQHDLDNIIADSKQIATANLKYLLNDIYTMVTVFHYENTTQGINRENAIKLNTIREAINKERSLMAQVMPAAVKEANKDEYKNWPEQRARIL